MRWESWPCMLKQVVQFSLSISVYRCRTCMFLKRSNKFKLKMSSCCNFSLGSVFCHDSCVLIVWLGLGWENIMIWPKISGSPQTSLSKMTSLVAANSCWNVLAENILTFLVLCHQIVGNYPDISLKMSVFFNSNTAVSGLSPADWNMNCGDSDFDFKDWRLTIEVT